MTAMTHIAVQEALNGKSVDWMEQVTDTQKPDLIEGEVTSRSIWTHTECVRSATMIHCVFNRAFLRRSSFSMTAIAMANWSK
jgi:hypothetical protein